MIADKGFLHSIWPVDFDQRQRKLYGEYALQEAERERRSTIEDVPRNVENGGAALLALSR